MQQPDSSSCELFTIAYVVDITLRLDQEKFICNVPQVPITFA